MGRKIFRVAEVEYYNREMSYSWSKPAMSDRNALLGRTIRHYLHEGRTLNDLLSFWQTKI